jgi:hypothetical protein
MAAKKLALAAKSALFMAGQVRLKITSGSPRSSNFGPSSFFFSSCFTIQVSKMLEQCWNKPSLGKTSVQIQACARMGAFCLMGHAFGGSSMKRTRTKIPKETP